MITGGGSIAWIDDAGRLRVGPRSAGAVPGPACYGRGGEQATVTDANLALGRIDTGRFAGGQMPLDVERARAAIDAGVGRPLGLSIDEAAAGIVAISNANMARAIRASLYERGLDPADFALVSFGGAGGLHAAELAQETGIGTVVFPRGAGTFSAFGILASDIVHSLVRSKLQPLDADAAASLAGQAAALRAEADALLDADRVPPERRHFELALDLRYRGQGYELTVPLEDTTATAVAAAGTRFHTLHEQRFAHADPAAPVDAVALRLTATGRVNRPAPVAYAPRPPGGPSRTALVFGGGGWQRMPVLERDTIGIDAPVAGPAIVTEDYSTTWLPAGWQVSAAPTGDLVARRR